MTIRPALRRPCAWLWAGLVLATAPLFAQGQSPTDNTLVTERLAAIQAGASQPSVYTPAETVAGAVAYRPLPRRADPAFDPTAVEAALAYAATHGPGEVIVWHDGAVFAQRAVGGAALDAAYDSFSMHKSLVALLIGQAIADGRIRSVEQAAADYLPEWRGDARARIRIVDLLRMNGGIERQRLQMRASPYNLETRMLFGDDVWGPALARGVAAPPGTEFYYNNVEAQLLGIIVERATGRRYADYLSERLWRPLGARDAQLWLDRPGGHPRTYCCMMSHAEDWVRVGRLFLDQGRIDGRQVVPAAWIKAQATPSPLNPGYGYQTWLLADPALMISEGTGSPKAVSEPVLAKDAVMLLGFGGQRTYIVPSCRLIVVRMGPRAGAWDHALMLNPILRGLGKACPTTAHPPREQAAGATRTAPALP